MRWFKIWKKLRKRGIRLSKNPFRPTKKKISLTAFLIQILRNRNKFYQRMRSCPRIRWTRIRLEALIGSLRRVTSTIDSENEIGTTRTAAITITTGTNTRWNTLRKWKSENLAIMFYINLTMNFLFDSKQYYKLIKDCLTLLGDTIKENIRNQMYNAAYD